MVAPIDLEYQERVRRELPALKHARLQREQYEGTMNKLAVPHCSPSRSRLTRPRSRMTWPRLGDMDGDSAPNAMGGQMGMGAHMVMTDSRPQTPQDIERAHDVLDTLRRALVEISRLSGGACPRTTRFFCRRCRRRFTTSPTTPPRSGNTPAISIRRILARCFT